MKENLLELTSVAGIVALTVVAVACVGYLVALFTGAEVKAPEWLVGAVGAVVGYFFGKRTNGGAS